MQVGAGNNWESFGLMQRTTNLINESILTNEKSLRVRSVLLHAFRREALQEPKSHQLVTLQKGDSEKADGDENKRKKRYYNTVLVHDLTQGRCSNRMSQKKRYNTCVACDASPVLHATMAVYFALISFQPANSTCILTEEKTYAERAKRVAMAHWSIMVKVACRQETWTVIPVNVKSPRFMDDHVCAPE